MNMTVNDFADELRKWWAFDDRQQHTHSWHGREDFIKDKLPELLRGAVNLKKRPVAWRVKDYADGWIIFQNENDAYMYAESTGALIQALYVRDGK